MSETQLDHIRRCWNCKQLIDKDPCPVCTKTRAEYSNADKEKLDAHLWQMANS